jgi:hypothetical protein
MSATAIIIITLAIGIIIGGVLVLKNSARKFNLTPEQRDKIKKRNEALDEEEKKSDS